MFKLMRKVVSIIIMVAFIATSIHPPSAQADMMQGLPVPGVMVHLSPAYTPAIFRGMTIDAKNPFAMSFLVDPGDDKTPADEQKVYYQKLIKYFLAAMTISEDKQWVNLSPYEKNRIIDIDFGKTSMGRDLLAEDYLLKQITSSLMYPEDAVGKKFWQKIYQQAEEKYGTTQIPVNTFNKVWILPETASVYEKGNTVLIVSSKLRVMLEEDYLSLQKHSGIVSQAKSTDVKGVNKLGSQMMRELILPALEKEVNEGKNFAQLRQIYHGMVLATWYKQALKRSILTQIYANKNKVSGVDLPNPNKSQQEIYQQYLRAFKKGVYNFIKEEQDPVTGEVIPRKYFAGGFVRGTAEIKRVDEAMASRLFRNYLGAGLLAVSALLLPSTPVLAQTPQRPAVVVSGVNISSARPVASWEQAAEVGDIFYLGTGFKEYGGVFNSLSGERYRDGGTTYITLNGKQIVYFATAFNPKKEFKVDPNVLYISKDAVLLKTDNGTFLISRSGPDVGVNIPVKITPVAASQVPSSTTVAQNQNGNRPSVVNGINIASARAAANWEEARKVSDIFYYGGKSLGTNNIFNSLEVLVNKDGGTTWVRLGGKEIIYVETAFSPRKGFQVNGNILYVNDATVLIQTDKGVFLLERTGPDRDFNTTVRVTKVQDAVAGGLSTSNTPVSRPERVVMNYRQVMTREDLDRRMDEIPRALRPGITFSAPSRDGETTINVNQRPLVNVTSLTALSVDNGDVYIAHLDEANGNQTKFGRVTSDGKVEEFTDASRLPSQVRSEFGISGGNGVSGGQVQAPATTKIAMQYNRVMSRDDMDRRIDEIPQTERPGIRFSTPIRDGEMKVTYGSKSVNVTSVTAFGAANGDVYLIELDEDNNNRPTLVILKSTGTLEETTDFSKIPQQMRKDFGIDRADRASLARRNDDPLGGIDLNSANLDLKIRRDGSGVPLPLTNQDPAMLSAQGFIPIVVGIKSAEGLPILSELKNFLN